MVSTNLNLNQDCEWVYQDLSARTLSLAAPFHATSRQLKHHPRPFVVLHLRGDRGDGREIVLTIDPD